MSAIDYSIWKKAELASKYYWGPRIGSICMSVGVVVINVCRDTIIITLPGHIEWRREKCYERLCYPRGPDSYIGRGVNYPHGVTKAFYILAQQIEAIRPLPSPISAAIAEYLAPDITL